MIEKKNDLVVIRSLPAGDEADAGPRPPAPRRECAAAAEAARGDHGDGLAGEEQQQRADAVRRGGVGAVDAVGPAVGVRVHVVHLRAGCGWMDMFSSGPLVANRISNKQITAPSILHG